MYRETVSQNVIDLGLLVTPHPPFLPLSPVVHFDFRGLSEEINMATAHSKLRVSQSLEPLLILNRAEVAT